MQVGEDDAWDLHQGDDEGALRHGAQVVAERAPRGRDDGQRRDVRLVPAAEPTGFTLRIINSYCIGPNIRRGIFPGNTSDKVSSYIRV